MSAVLFDDVNEPSQIFPHPLKEGSHLHNRLGFHTNAVQMLTRISSFSYFFKFMLNDSE